MINPRVQNRPGHTVLELVVAMGSATLLLAGLGSTVFLASQALDHDGCAAVRSTRAGEALSEVMHDLHHALSFSERTATAVTFQVPDRDGDNLPETLRYSWPDGPDSPLYIRINGSAAAPLIENVDQFNIGYSLRAVDGTGFAKGAITIVLLVVTDVDNPTTQESARQTLFESWKFTVLLIDDGGSGADFQAAAAEADMVYVPDTVDPASLGTKLKDTEIGIVNEHGELLDEFSLAAGAKYETHNEVWVSDTEHYITSAFSAPGYYVICSSQQPFSALDTNFAPGMVTLAHTSKGGEGDDGNPSLVVVEIGEPLNDGTPAPGRRVSVPWGDSGFDVGSLNENGRTIMKRAVKWAAGDGT